MLSCLFACALLVDGTVTYHEDIEPLLQAHCLECHHHDGDAPFSLEQFADVAGWAPMIREVVRERRMPPWGASPDHGKFANDRSLPQTTIDRIASWVDQGAPRGDPAHAPPRKTWSNDWALGTPDAVFVTPSFTVPAQGTLPYEYVRIATSFDADRWVRAAQVRNSGRDAVHHVLTFLEASPESRARSAPLASTRPWRPAFNQFDLLQGAKLTEYPEWIKRFRKLIEHDLRIGEAGGMNGYFHTNEAGSGPTLYAANEGKLLPAHATLVFQIHYQPNGTVRQSETSLALWFRNDAPDSALDARGIATVVFAIPPRTADHQVEATYRLPRAATLRSLRPHMHRRGKSFRYLAEYPDGTSEILLDVPLYDFNWQHEYLLAQPLHLPRNTVLHVIAHYDNSAANKNNPDPDQTVYFGLQTQEEMMIGYFEVAWDQSAG